MHLERYREHRGHSEKGNKVHKLLKRPYEMASKEDTKMNVCQI